MHLLGPTVLVVASLATPMPLQAIPTTRTVNPSVPVGPVVPVGLVDGSKAT
jgi:hypothetical protein